MATHAKFFRNTVNAFFCLAFFCAGQVQAAFVAASSDMVINNLRFALSDTSAQFEWTDDWYGEVIAHAADSDSLPADDFDSLLGNDGSIQAIANTAHVSSLANYSVVNGTQIGLDPNAGITGTTHSDLHLERKHMQADGFAITNFDNYFMVTRGCCRFVFIPLKCNESRRMIYYFQSKNKVFTHRNLTPALYKINAGSLPSKSRVRAVVADTSFFRQVDR